MKILIAGAGNMGKTYARSLLAHHFVQSTDLLVFDHKPQQDEFLKNVPPQNILTHPTDAIAQADIVLLCVKPQDFAALAAEIKPYVHEQQLILSIMAGITLSTLQQSLHSTKVVRAMPNLPAQIGMGMTVFTCSAAIDRKELFIVQNLLNATGKSLYVENETLIDAATAISGSGPAYVYYFMQSIIDKAVAFGFSKQAAELMANQTFMGAVHLHNQYDLSCEDWIIKVASKGGTTEAALARFASKHLSGSIQEGLQAAADRARELGKAK